MTTANRFTINRVDRITFAVEKLDDACRFATDSGLTAVDTGNATGHLFHTADGSEIEFVATDMSILDGPLESGVDVPHACTEGICGACQTKVLQGTPDHRDSYLSPSEMKSAKTIMICCSGSKCEELVLDL